MAQGKEPPAQAPTMSDLYFGPFRLEQGARLWSGHQQVAIRPRPLAVLRYLAERPGQLIPGEELLNRLWPGTYVTKVVLRVCVRELRQALRDDRVTPQFIETVGRQGYRFIGDAVSSQRQDGNREPIASEGNHHIQRAPYSQSLAPHFVGRTQELARLHACLTRARQGARQITFLSGQPGVGKTTLVDRFLEQILQETGDGRREPSPPSSHVSNRTSQVPSPRIGRGQCVEQYGPQEAYLPLLEAVGQLCRDPGGEPVLAALRRHAPTWLAQLSGPHDADRQDVKQSRGQGNGRERMLRELAEAVESIAADGVLVLVLEDLQWSDPSTLEVLVYLARRRRPVQLHIVGTYRPADMVAHEHPARRMVQELSGQRQCEEVTLELLRAGDVEAYLRRRLGQETLPALSELIYRRTDGNALFMVSFVDYLLQQELLVASNSQVQLRVELNTLDRLVPDNLQQVIRHQVERLSADTQQWLRVASVDGMTFTATAVAGVAERPLEEVEEVYDDLATREQLITGAGIMEWPDGTVGARYTFRHALYQQVLYEQVGQARRLRLHRQLGEQKEAHYGERTSEVASELAVHFTEGREYRKATQYRCQAGKIALQRNAYQEALAHAQAGLNLIRHQPDTSERQREELALRMVLSGTLAPIRGYLAEEVIENLARARDLCYMLNDDATLGAVLINLGRAYEVRSDRVAITQLIAEELSLLDRVQEPALALQLHTHLGTSSLLRGALTQAQEHYDQARKLYDPRQHRELFLHFGLDPAVIGGVNSSNGLWLAGWPDQARSRLQTSLSWAKELGHSFSLAYALILGAPVRLWCGDLDGAGRLIAEGEQVGSEYNGVVFRVGGGVLQACIQAHRGEAEVELELLTKRLLQYCSMGMRHLMSLYFCFVAEAYRQMGRVEEGLVSIAEAVHLTEAGVDIFWAAEVYRLTGELMLQKFRVASSELRVGQERRSKIQGSKFSKTNSQHLNPNAPTEAEAYFLKALEIARRQEAKSLELRTAMSLSRLWHGQGKRAEARTLLTEVYGWFTEGFDTTDLREAKALLDALRS
jgi:DNA-binding winged helix-turn-helix (wHTH) protein/tetratricopeptide (TPR) repeat protein